LHLPRRWLANHEAIGALLGCPEPLHVTPVRVTLRILILPSDTAASE
jgi:hypothetical protein